LETLSRLRALAAEESSHRLIWYLYQQTDLLAVCSAMADGKRRRANLLALYDAARRFESAGHKGLFGFLTHVARMIENGLSVPVENAAGGGVRILSIHKSKGLEFPVVFLCGLERQFNEADSRATILFHDRLGLGPKRTDRQRMLRYTTIARDAVALRLRQQLRAEELRLLYVAMTRAEHKLFLFAAVNGGRGENLSTLALQAQCPPPPRLMAQARSMAPWVLIPALCRPDSGALWDSVEADRPGPAPWLGPRWDICLLDGSKYENPLAPWPTAVPKAEPPGGEPEDSQELIRRFTWRYPHAHSVDMPSKLTATQLKGREKDTEVAEDAQTPTEPVTPDRPRGSAGLRRPIFEAERPLTATERGTALHMAMQYLDYEKTDTEEDIREEVARLVAGQFLTPAQGQAVDVKAIRALFASPLGRKLRTAPQVEREFKFSMLVPAADYYPEGEPGETLLLQGVVDCWFREEDGTVTVVDFKTDHVTEDTIDQRAAGYRPQLDAYTRALSEVMETPVSRRVLWFFALNREISW
jgi:ATP-dependent helicase/nuclease subunit A